MSNQVEAQLGSLPENWIHLEPNDFSYGRYAPNIIAAMYKASEVFQAFCQARSLLIDSAAVDNQEPDGLGRTFRKATAALMQYISCWDLSWQPLWFKYVEEPNSNLIENVGYYEKRIDKCRIGQLKTSLKEKDCNSIVEHLERHDKDEFWSFLRDTYNYMKHRGTHHIQGIGENPQYACFIVNDNRPKMIFHREFDVNEWTANLIRFNREFIEYYNVIIKEVTPDNYFDPIKGDELMHVLSKFVN